MLRLRVVPDTHEAVEFLAADVDEIQARLNHLEGPAHRLASGGRTRLKEVELWHGGRWWNLKADLRTYCTWRLASGQHSQSEIESFLSAPTSRPDWLYEAAAQLHQVLDAAGLALMRRD